MKSLVLMIVLLSAFLCSCYSTYYVAPGASTVGDDTLTVAMLNDKLLDRSAVVTDTSSRAYEATDILVTADSCTFLDGEGRERLALPLGRVRSIEKKEHGGGAVAGLGYGALTGVAWGAVVGFSADTGDAFGPAAGRMIYMAAGGSVGAASGLMLGAIIGSTFTYYILPAASQ